MLKLSAFFAGCLILVSAVFAQPPTVEWSRVFGGPGFESLWACTPVAGGRYLIAGETTSYGAGSDDFWVKLLDANGNSIWTKTYGTPASDICTYCIPTSDGGFMAVGWRGYSGAQTGAGWMIKLNANGDSLWSRALGDTEEGFFYFVQQTSDNGYIVAGGKRPSPSTGWDAWLVKTDAGGQVQWQRTYGGTNTDDFIAVSIASDGGFLAAGDTRSFGAGDYDGWILKTNANGDSLWSRTFGSTTTEGFYTAPRTADNGYLLTGYRDSLFAAGTNDWMIVKTDDLGNPQWTKYYGRPGADDVPWQGTQTADGGYIVAGYFEYPDSNGIDMVGLRLNAAGDSLWSARFSGDSTDYGWFVAVTPDGGYLFGADSYSFGAGDDDWWVVKTRTACADPTPLPPQVVIRPSGADARLYWRPVKLSQGGCAISATHYLVFNSQTFSGPYYYHGYATDSTYAHVGALAYATSQYYHVIASGDPLPNWLTQLSEGAALSEHEVLERLSRAPLSSAPVIEKMAGSVSKRTEPSTAQREHAANRMLHHMPPSRTR
jgi:hypothetical protein